MSHLGKSQERDGSCSFPGHVAGMPWGGTAPLGPCPWFGAQVWDGRCGEALGDEIPPVGTAGKGALGARAASTARPRSKRPAWDLWKPWWLQQGWECETPHYTAPAARPGRSQGWWCQSLQGAAQHYRARQGSPLHLSSGAVSALFSACDMFLLSLLGKNREGKQISPCQAAEDVPGCPWQVWLRTWTMGRCRRPRDPCLALCSNSNFNLSTVLWICCFISFSSQLLSFPHRLFYSSCFPPSLFLLLYNWIICSL